MCICKQDECQIDWSVLVVLFPVCRCALYHMHGRSHQSSHTRVLTHLFKSLIKCLVFLIQHQIPDLRTLFLGQTPL